MLWDASTFLMILLVKSFDLYRFPIIHFALVLIATSDWKETKKAHLLHKNTRKHANTLLHLA